MTISLIWFLYIFFAFLVLFALFSLFNFYLIYSTGTFTIISFLVTFLMIAATVLILYGTWFFLRDVDWTQTVTLFQGIQYAP